ncbi:MAG: class I SAM-dependent methyltransferase [Methylocella sp.]
MIKETFSASFPSHQAGMDLFEDGWYSRMPEGSGLVGGQADNFSDVRVAWAAKVLGGLAGKTILELGPFEAYSTSQFEAMGAASVLSIEGSASNFLKCLLVKNIIGLNATFLYGDFTKFVEITKNRFDICWASGVLYHLTSPIEFLEGISNVSDVIFIWTQYYDKEVIASHPTAHLYQEQKKKIVDYGGKKLTLHGRDYPERAATAPFSGGGDVMSYWMELDDITHVLRHRGFNRIEMGVNHPHFPAGPACFFLAFR